MAVKFVFGRSGYGKTNYITEQIVKRCANGEKSVLIVPEQYTHIAEHKLLSKVGSISPETVEVTSFKKMITSSERNQGISEVLTPLKKSIIVSDILSYTELQYFGEISKRVGFVDVCLKLISELKKYCVTCEMLNKAIENAKDERLKLKIGDIVKLYTEYDLRIKDLGFDDDDGAFLLAKSIASQDDLGGTVLFFDEFTSFIPQELSIIKELSKKADHVVITLCLDEDDDMLFAPTMDTLGKIRRMCKEANIEIVPSVNLTENHKHSTELKFLEENLLPYPDGKYDGDCECISILSSANPYEEVASVARRIVELCRDRNLRYRDIGVICSDIGTYSPYIKPLFEKHGISYFIDEKSPVLNHRIINFVLNIIDIYLNDYNSENVFSFLKSGFCDAQMESIYLLENYCQSTNMHKSTWLNDEKWNSLLEKYDFTDEQKESLCSVRDNIIKPLGSFHDSIKGRHDVLHMCKSLYEYLVNIGFVNKIEEKLKLFEKEKDVIHGEEYEKIWNIIVDALDSVANILGDKKINVANFRALLQTSFSGYSVGFIPTSLDHVFVGNITRSKMDNIKVLFVLGANDGTFPEAISTGDLINDGDKLSLANEGVELSADSKTRAFFERFFMYMAFTTPSDMLFVSFSRADSSSATLRPSFVLSDFKRVFTDLSIESDVLEDETDFGQMEYITAQIPTLEKMTEKITGYKNGDEISPVWFDVYDYFCKNFDFGTKLKKYYSHTNEAERIDRELMKNFVSDEFYTTVSRLQRYRSCKFSYFLEYILKLKDNESFDVTPMDTGSFVHSVIENLCRDMDSNGYGFSNVPDSYVYEKIDAFIEEFIKQLTENSAYISKRKLYLIKRLRESIFRCFSLVRNHILNSKFEPLGYEMRFDKDSIGCIEFDLGDGKKANLTGVIDRSDVYHGENGDYIRVIDYKTGNKVFNLTDVFYGLDIQLFVYLNALVESNDNYKYGGALYFKIDEPMFKADNKYDEDKTESKILSELKMKGLMLGEQAVLDATDPDTASSSKKATYDNFVHLDKHLRKIIKDLCTELSGGNIDISPYNKQTSSPCQYCGYKSICRFDVRKKGNNFDYIDKMKDEEIWEVLGGEQNVD